MAGLSPTLLSCSIHDDLLDASSWRRSDPFVFRDKVHFPEGVGIPFYESLTNKPLELAPGRFNAPTGWLEAQVVQIKDKHHIWYDPEGKTFHMFLRAHTGGIGYACLLKVREDKNGQMVTRPCRVHCPSLRHRHSPLPMPKFKTPVTTHRLHSTKTVNITSP